MALPTIDDYIVILSAEDCTGILSTKDCFMNPHLLHLCCYMFSLIQIDLRICFINVTSGLTLYMLLKDVPYIFDFAICCIM